MPCIFCQSTTHNYRHCPVTWQQAKRQQLNGRFTKDYFGKAPNVFIGQYGYPRVRVGILGTEEYKKHDDPQAWSAEGIPIPKIVRLRSELVNSYFQSPVKGSQGKFLDLTKDVSLAKRPVDVEVGMKEKPRFRITFTKDLAPHGPNVLMKHARVTENLPVDWRVDKVASATDLKAADAIAKLTKKADPYFLTKAFSMGNFGLPMERKLVPTKWSITAVDDIQGKAVLKDIRDHTETDCLAYFGGHLGNYYMILFFDDTWQYELFEQHLGSKQGWTDYESFQGRKTYAKDTAGGYYAARIGILNSLAQRKRQASVLALRVITDEYTAPLGVWVVREAVKKTMESEPMRFADRNLMIEYAKAFFKRKFSHDIEPTLKRSLLLKELFGQRKLTKY